MLITTACTSRNVARDGLEHAYTHMRLNVFAHACFFFLLLVLRKQPCPSFVPNAPAASVHHRDDLNPPFWMLLVQCLRESLRRRLVRKLAPTLPDERIAGRPDHMDLPIFATAVPARLDPQMVIHDCSSAYTYAHIHQYVYKRITYT